MIHHNHRALSKIKKIYEKTRKMKRHPKSIFMLDQGKRKPAFGPKDPMDC
jgi:ribosomal protein S2